MPDYEFQCYQCGLFFVAKTVQPMACPLGHTQIKREYGFSFHRKWDGGFSHTIGRYAANEHDVSEGLKAGSDTASEQTGMEHRYVMMDPRDRDATKVTEE